MPIENTGIGSFRGRKELMWVGGAMHSSYMSMQEMCSSHIT
jgi:hypothetical protein